MVLSRSQFLSTIFINDTLNRAAVKKKLCVIKQLDFVGENSQNTNV